MNIKRLLIALMLFCTVGGFCVALPTFSYAATKDVLLKSDGEFQKTLGATGQTKTSEHPAVLIVRIIMIVLTFLGILLLGLFLWAGFLYMTAGGEADKTKTAQQILLYAVIGTIIIVAAWGLTIWVIDTIQSKVITAPAVNSPDQPMLSDPKRCDEHTGIGCPGPGLNL